MNVLSDDLAGLAVPDTLDSLYQLTDVLLADSGVKSFD